MLKSSKIAAQEFLARRIPAAHLRKFFLDVANLRDDVEAVRRLLARHERILPRPLHLYQLFDTFSLANPAVTLRDVDEAALRSWFIPLRNWIQSVWLAKDIRTKRYLLYRLLDVEVYAREGRSSLTSQEEGEGRKPRAALWVSNTMFLQGPVSLEPSPPTPFEQALNYLLISASRTRKCANSECITPYFFANRRTQKYCCDACAKPAEREAKRRWWRTRGKAWRARRRSRSKKRTRKNTKIEKSLGGNADGIVAAT